MLFTDNRKSYSQASQTGYSQTTETLFTDISDMLFTDNTYVIHRSLGAEGGGGGGVEIMRTPLRMRFVVLPTPKSPLLGPDSNKTVWRELNRMGLQ